MKNVSFMIYLPLICMHNHNQYQFTKSKVKKKIEMVCSKKSFFAKLMITISLNRYTPHFSHLVLYLRKLSYKSE